MNRFIVTALILGSACGLAFAQATPVGLWKTIDDATQKEKSYVRIVDNAGVLTGKVERIIDPAKQADVCSQCEDARKNQPILGMTILEGVKKNGSEDQWDGGHILDPNNGKLYHVRLTPKDGGRQLEVRGYIGIPLLGRTQTWHRVE